MTQFQVPEDVSSAPVAPRTSAMAITALVFSLICCIPTTLLGVLLGLIAAVQIKGDPNKKGMGLAITAVVLGVVFSAGQFFGYSFMWKIMKQSMELIEDAPNDAMNAGYAADYQGFRDQFYGLGNGATDEEVQMFIDAVTDAYGDFQSAVPSQQQQPQFGQTQFVMPYNFSFTGGTATADVELVFSDPTTGAMVFKLGSIEIPLDDGNVIAFPTN